jgi:hypothetical protein
MGFLKALFVGKAESSWFSVPGFKPHDMEEGGRERGGPLFSNLTPVGKV